MSGSDHSKFAMVTYVGCVFGIVTLSACGGGGGGTGGTVTPTTTTTTSTTPFVYTVGAPEGASLNGNALPLASGTTPNFSTSLPTNGTTFPLDEAVIKSTYGSNQASVAGYTNSLTGGATLTFQGTASTNTTVLSRNIFELKIPALSVDASNILGNSITTLSDGREVTLRTSALNYSLLGAWEVVARKPGASLPDTSVWGLGFTGYQTPTSGIPSSGTATYTAGPAGNVTEGLSAGGGVAGLAMPGRYDLKGQASIDVNFGSSKVNGSLFSMTSYNSGPALDPVPWNNVSLSGSLSGATMQGTTAVTSAPSDPAALSSSATGTFTGSLFGPKAQELGLSWTLYDPSGNGKSAVGVVGATAP
jgi:hypothetical protein